MRPSVPMTIGHLVNGGRVEGGGQADGLGEFGGAVGGDAVQRLAPPVVGGNVQARNGARLVDQLAGLLFQRHALDQVGGALLRRQAGVEVGGLLRSPAPRPHTTSRSRSMLPLPTANSKFLIGFLAGGHGFVEGSLRDEKSFARSPDGNANARSERSVKRHGVAQSSVKNRFTAGQGRLSWLARHGQMQPKMGRKSSRFGMGVTFTGIHP